MTAIDVRKTALSVLKIVALLAVLRLRGPIWALALLGLYVAIRLSLNAWQRRRSAWRPPQ